MVSRSALKEKVLAQDQLDPKRQRRLHEVMHKDLRQSKSIEVGETGKGRVRTQTY